MNNWFTIEEIDNETFAISEYKHWEETHCYLLCGSDRAVLIDSGLGVGNIRKVTDSLTSLPITVITTHAHWDHIGGHKNFEYIAVHEAESEWLTTAFPITLNQVKDNLLLKPCDFPSDFSIEDYEIFQGTPQKVLHDRDYIDIGNRRIEVIHTPGHSPGHCCFYESDRKYLYSGDLIYRGCLDAFYPSTDPLQFRQSVKKILNYYILKVLPGHHQLNIPTDIIGKTENAFDQLYASGKLKQGSGIFDYTDFKIHI